nr:MAG TPA: hypothetical protein [Caudoviricetes sp.]
MNKYNPTKSVQPQTGNAVGEDVRYTGTEKTVK